jgi:segregation and condensation protein B
METNWESVYPEAEAASGQAELFDAELIQQPPRETAAAGTELGEGVPAAMPAAMPAVSGNSDFWGAALVEAVLFLETEPIDEKQIARITSMAENSVETALETLRERYTRPGSGFDIVRIGGGLTIAPKREYWDILKERYGRKNQAKLSRAAMETLAIIAYSQPITRAEIEAIRGVQADNMIRILLERGLIREAGKKDIAGHPVQFGTTKEFLSLFRLESIASLPKLDENDAERFAAQDDVPDVQGVQNVQNGAQDDE